MELRDFFLISVGSKAKEDLFKQDFRLLFYDFLGTIWKAIYFSLDPKRLLRKLTSFDGLDSDEVYDLMTFPSMSCSLLIIFSA